MPTYSLYGIASRIEGGEVVGCSLGDVPEASVIWICNPHNPIGSVYPCAEIVALAKRRPEALIVVDEAYVEYGGETMVPFLEQAPNCVVLRTLSKAFGFAALRVGYAVCSAGRGGGVAQAQRAGAGDGALGPDRCRRAA